MHEVIIGLKSSKDGLTEFVCEECIELDLDFRGYVRMAYSDELTVGYVPHGNIAYMVVTKEEKSNG